MTDSSTASMPANPRYPFYNFPITVRFANDGNATTAVIDSETVRGTIYRALSESLPLLGLQLETKLNTPTHTTFVFTAVYVPQPDDQIKSKKDVDSAAKSTTFAAVCEVPSQNPESHLILGQDQVEHLLQVMTEVVRDLGGVYPDFTVKASVTSANNKQIPVSTQDSLGPRTPVRGNSRQRVGAGCPGCQP